MSRQPFWPHFETSVRNLKKIKKNIKPSHCVMLCDIVSIKNYKLGISWFFRKGVLINELSCMKCIGFQGKSPCYGHNHGIVCLNDAILCTRVRLQMANKCYTRIFPTLMEENSFFIFWGPEGEIFVKHLGRICFKMVSPYFSKLLDYIWSIIHHLVWTLQLSSQLSEKRQSFIDLAGAA